MLYENTIAPATLGLLKELMKVEGGYAAIDIGFVVRSLTYFEGAEHSKDAILLKNLTWNEAKQKIQQAVQDFWRA